MHSAVETSTDHIAQELDSERSLYYYRAILRPPVVVPPNAALSEFANASGSLGLTMIPFTSPVRLLIATTLLL
jgi:hypothetical protein